MFAAIRTYGVTDIDELSELVKDGFVPIVESVPGFVAYYAIDAGDGIATSITICEDKAGVDESTSRAAAWVEENALDFIESGPAVVTGAVTAETAATRLAAYIIRGIRQLLHGLRRAREGGPCRPIAQRRETLARTAAPAAVRTIVPPGARFA